MSIPHKHFSVLFAVPFLLLLMLLQPATGSAGTFKTGSSLRDHEAATGTPGSATDTAASLAGRHRIEINMGYWDSGSRLNRPLVSDVEDRTRIENLVGTVSYFYWGFDRLAAGVTFKGLVAEAISIDRVTEGTESAVVIASTIFGVRLYPLSSAQTPFRPFVSAGIGPSVGIETIEKRYNLLYRSERTTRTFGTFGGYLGGGLDIQVGRHLMLGIQAGYNTMLDFSEPVGYEDNYSGIEFSAGFSLLFG